MFGSKQNLTLKIRLIQKLGVYLQQKKILMVKVYG
jgi:hypothetical protein